MDAGENDAKTITQNFIASLENVRKEILHLGELLVSDDYSVATVTKCTNAIENGLRTHFGHFHELSGRAPVGPIRALITDMGVQCLAAFNLITAASHDIQKDAMNGIIP